MSKYRNRSNDINASAMLIHVECFETLFVFLDDQEVKTSPSKGGVLYIDGQYVHYYPSQPRR